MSEPRRRRRIPRPEEPAQEIPQEQALPTEQPAPQQPVLQPEPQEEAAPQHEPQAAPRPRPAKQPVRKAKRRKRNHTKTILIVLACVLAALLLIAGAVLLIFGDDIKFDIAKKNLAAGEYAKALDAFTELGTYEDASKYQMYTGAVLLAQSGKYSDAISSLTSLGDFLDSRLLSTYYAGMNAHALGEYEQAMELFGSIATFRDSAQKKNDAWDASLTRQFDLLAQKWHDKESYIFTSEVLSVLELKYSNSQTRMYENFYDLGKKFMEESASDTLEGAQRLRLRNEAYVVFSYLIYVAETDPAAREAINSRESVSPIMYQLAQSYMEVQNYRTAANLTRYLDAPQAQALFKESSYLYAKELILSNFVSSAYTLLDLIGEYKDAAEIKTSIETNYNEADSLASEGKWQEAADKFAQLHDYQDSADRTLTCRYNAANAMLDEGLFEEARAAFASLSDYSDAADRVKEAYYRQAELLMEGGFWDDAKNAFSNAQGYSDAKERIFEPYYRQAEALMDAGLWDEASDAFWKAATYKDAMSRINEPYYRQGEALMAEGKYLEAYDAYKKCGTYSDAKQKLGQALFLYAGTLTQEKRYDEATLYYQDLTDNLRRGQTYTFTDVELSAAFNACRIAQADQLLANNQPELAKPLYDVAGHTAGSTECIYQIALQQMTAVPHYSYWQFEALGDYKDSRALAQSLYSKRFETVSDPDANGNRTYIGRDGLHSGLLDANYNVIQEAKYVKVTTVRGGTVYILKDDMSRYRIADAKGKLISDAVYSELKDGSNDGSTLLVKENNLWGYVDAKTGKILVPAEWKDAAPMYDGYAYVKNNLDLWGVIDRNGKVIVTPKYSGDYYSSYRSDEENASRGFAVYSDCGHAVLEGIRAILNHKGEKVFAFAKDHSDHDIEYLGNGVFIDCDGCELFDAYEKVSYSYTAGKSSVSGMRKVGKNLISCSVYDSNNWKTYYAVIDTEKAAFVSEYAWSEEIKYIPGPAKMDKKYGWLGADGTAVLKPEWDSMCEWPQNGCVIAGKYNAQGNLVYSVFADGTGKLLKDGFTSLEEAKEYTTTVSGKNKETYAQAEKLLGLSDYLGAAGLFTQLADANYPDAAQRRDEAYYLMAQAQLASGDEAGAIAAFKLAGAYNQADKQWKSICYAQAERHLAEGSWQAASDAFVASGDYEDASERIYEPFYRQAEALLAQGSWQAASDAFAAAGSYKDASERVYEPFYRQAEALLAQGSWQAASDAFSSANGYKDATKRAYEPFYRQAEALLADSKEEEAIVAFKQAGLFKDAEQRWKQIYYQQGERHLAAKQWTTACEAFTLAEGYSNAADRKLEVYYAMGEALEKDKKYQEAREAFLSAEKYRDALKRAYTIAYDHLYVGKIGGGYRHTAALKSNGKVLTAGNCENIQKVSGWSDIIAIAVGGRHIVGLKSNGTVVAVGDANACQVSGWTDIVAIAANWHSTFGLKADGTILISSYHAHHPYYKLKNAGSKEFFVEIGASGNAAYAVTADGEIYYSNNKIDGVKSISEIRAIYDTVGYTSMIDLNADGTVSFYDPKKLDVSSWKDIVELYPGDEHLLGKTRSGRFLATGNSEFGQCDISGWSDIVAISAGWDHTIGVKKNGKVVAIGKNDKKQCSVSGWDLW